MSSPTVFSPAPRVAPNARHAFGGIFRLTFHRFLTPGHGLALAGSLAVLALLGFANVSASRGADNYFDWVAQFYLTVLVPVIAFITAAGAVRDDMKSTSVDYVLTRPVRRPAFIAFKYLSHVACSQVDFLAAFAVVIGLGVFRDIPGLASALPRLLLAQVFVVAAFSALGFLAGALTGRYTFLGLAYGAIIEVGVGQIPTQLSKLSMTAQVRAMLRPLTETPEALAAATDPQTSVAATLALLLVFAVVMVITTAGIFSARELSAPNEA